MVAGQRAPSTGRSCGHHLSAFYVNSIANAVAIIVPRPAFRDGYWASSICRWEITMLRIGGVMFSRAPSRVSASLLSS